MPETKNMIPVGTIGDVADFAPRQPYRGVVLGYDMFHTKYQIGREYLPGKYLDARAASWAFPKQVTPATSGSS